MILLCGLMGLRLALTLAEVVSSIAINLLLLASPVKTISFTLSAVLLDVLSATGVSLHIAIVNSLEPVLVAHPLKDTALQFSGTICAWPISKKALGAIVILPKVVPPESILIKYGDLLSSIDEKLDMLTERLLNPDDGVTARVNRNTSMRKILVKAMWVIYTITLGAILKIFTD
eukprot:SAG11_NODE_10092_length_856_cov_0.675033_1_plen_174_part_00